MFKQKKWTQPMSDNTEKAIEKDRPFIGSLVEERFTIRMMDRGVRVLKPVDPSSPYDSVIDISGELYKVQIKKGTRRKDAEQHKQFYVDLRAGGHKQNQRSDGKRYSEEEVDYFAIYDEREDMFFLVPHSDVGGKSISITKDSRRTKYRLEQRLDRIMSQTNIGEW